WAIRMQKEHKNTPIVHTTLLTNRQIQAEQITKNYVNRLRSINIHNAAVLVVNNQTLNVEAYVGSADFQNIFDGGQVDGIRAVRSPGSTLKPLLYGVAFDRGLLSPKSTLNDVPTNFGGFEPENFDRHFNGKVTVEFALANSLNIPAVKVLKDISPSVFIEYLKKADFQTIKKQSKDLGLSMILGGCGVTLEELTRLFASFANQGKIQPLHYLQSNEKTTKPAEVLISAEASYLITNILTQITRPDLPNNFDNTYHLPRIAWKTGTSYGKKDAWSIGYNQHYTVGVWIGNFSGTGVPELNGTNIATPLLFDIFNAIDYNSPKGWFHPAANIISRKVCAESGDVPNSFCNHQIIDYAIMGISPSRKCQHLKWVFTNRNETLSYCSQCLPDTGFQRKLYPNLSPELIAYNESKQIPYVKIPSHNPYCTRIFQAGAPTITSPNDGSEYFLDDQQMQLSCQVSNDVTMVYWYVNDKLVEKTKPQSPVFFSPPPGKVKISCSDDRGRNSDIYINVPIAK
ncbi:MAG: penicillin-binding protein 1C, partial [Runella zeae]